MQVKHDSALLFLGLEPIPEFFQLFVAEKSNQGVDLISIKIFDDILASGTSAELRNPANNFGEEFSLGNVSHGPGNIR